ncbi:thiamine phosphate synthase [Aliarcobacter cibarius]|jgi:thiamine-phosphate pyrophosphorylase|uniref:Thiamine phosphate synthase n=1 Tax=Aliarcobacter cibarius TaxID=255507 RepID=A0A5J6RF68_9BACT|nr:thiamine phosphate synthase [Aliarcobacter cibarius]QEZ88454.1 thiamine phosphate synthase (TMP-TENI domain) [Aliarcobacter cibarius]QKJ26465.1 thiamine phosphate synthase (TMP-TENI domain) [Aliarcobacter cibarius]TLT01952.1 thiamine phosphate synthase [Aliarcobacter cibarius]TLT02287.1 thiamine phosphate synthase [Aliarcobacter cibarius]TLT04718.1 thiamine phosphate synthase [Aliarcobacter cibarius]
MKKLKSYLITDPTFFTNNPIDFERKLKEVLTNYKIDIACLRDKTSNNIEELAEIFLKVCKKFSIEKILINSNLSLATKMKFDGIHLNSSQFNEIEKVKKLNLFTIISCHNFDELEKASKLGLNFVTYSPIFDTPNKGEPKGINNLDETIKKFPNLNIIALGGIISDNQVKQIEKTSAYGFASIRYFV